MDYADNLDMMDDDCDIEAFPLKSIHSTYKKKAKKKNTKRCDHKHQYEKCIVFGWLGRPSFGKYCTVCNKAVEGNVMSGESKLYEASYKDGIGKFFSPKSVDKLHIQYPDMKIFVTDDKDKQLNFVEV